MVRGELKQVAPVGPDRVRGGVGVSQVGEEVAQVPGERVRGPQLPGHGRIHDWHRPDVLFLDEPTSGLDRANAAEVRAVIRAQADAGRTVFLTTHDMPAVEELCTRVAFMRDGAIVAIDTPRNLRLAYSRRSVMVEFTEAGRVRHAEFPAADDPGLLALLATGRVQTVHTREAALAEVFIAVTNRTPAGATP
jgi:fluoroquinolone transport system ATP-binding protein